MSSTIGSYHVTLTRKGVDVTNYLANPDLDEVPPFLPKWQYRKEESKSEAVNRICAFFKFFSPQQILEEEWTADIVPSGIVSSWAPPVSLFLGDWNGVPYLLSEQGGVVCIPLGLGVPAPTQDQPVAALLAATKLQAGTDKLISTTLYWWWDSLKYGVAQLAEKSYDEFVTAGISSGLLVETQSHGMEFQVRALPWEIQRA